MLTITDQTLVIVVDQDGGSEPIALAQFFTDNVDGIDADEQSFILGVLRGGGFYQAGGGAMPVWTLAPVASRADLTASYQAWVEAEDLPKVSADDQDPATLNAEQAWWLDVFRHRWDAA